MGRWNCRKKGAKDGETEELALQGLPLKSEVEQQQQPPLEGSSGGAPQKQKPRWAWRFLGALKSLGTSIHAQILKLGEDWVFLFLLGISMATISYGLDVVTSKLQQANLWVSDELVDYRYLQYFSWILYHVVLMMVSAAAAKYISPQAAGSGIPELKVALRGVMLHEFFTFRTFVAKLVGVICTLAGGSTVFLGKVGPFVHMATILAMLLGKVMVKFGGSNENPGRKSELLVAGIAVGVACCFVAPVGGVLFGVEATGTHFAVRDYWRGFFAATCAALTFRLLAMLSGTRETVAVLFRTSWQVEFPYDLPELLSYAILGGLCGGLCCVFLFCHRNILTFLQNRPRINLFMGNNQILYAGFISLVLASITFPHGSGQYIGARLSMKELLETLFNNKTWGMEEASVGPNATCQPPSFCWLQWTHPVLSSLEMVSFFLIAKFFMTLLATSMRVPAGYFLPVFVYGAALGRLYGEVVAQIFPDGIVSEGIRMHVTPAGYALAGAAAYSGAVTQTLSPALLTFELTGQMSHILPVLVAVLVANAVSQGSQPSFFEGIILAKQLPFLPKLSGGGSRGHDLYVEDFMVTELQYLTRETKYKDLRRLLRTSSLKGFPLVDTQESRVLLGSIKRTHLCRLLSDRLSAERRFQFVLSHWDEAAGSQPLEPGGHERETEKSGSSQEKEPSSFHIEDTVVEEEEEQASNAVPGSPGSLSPQNERTWYCNVVEEWTCRQLQEAIHLESLPVDPAPYRLLEKETLYQCYDLFHLLSLHRAYVTNTGRLVGVVGLKELRAAVEGCVKGTFTSPSCPASAQARQLGTITIRKGSAQEHPSLEPRTGRSLDGANRRTPNV